ncbi:MAG: CpsD/CapB family tyrosine-protein kinase [Acidobacteria bacterium]|nr:CpsD/CapB family tyrosine-protein kinase [Acidobacteriota bacterium]
MKGILELSPGVAAMADPPATRAAVAEELVCFTAPSSFEANHYRALRHCVEQLTSAGASKVIAVTSATAAEGKTVTALNLAGSLAHAAERRILVIDADLRRPALAEYLELPQTGIPGLSEALLNADCPLSKATRRLDPLNISVTLAGEVRPRSLEALTSERFAQLLDEARHAYDYVLLDTAPALPVADCRILERWVDGFVLVVAAHATPRSLVAQVLQVVPPAKIAAVALNNDDRRVPPSYRYYHTTGARQKPARGR